MYTVISYKCNTSSYIPLVMMLFCIVMFGSEDYQRITCSLPQMFLQKSSLLSLWGMHGNESSLNYKSFTTFSNVWFKNTHSNYCGVIHHLIDYLANHNDNAPPKPNVQTYLLWHYWLNLLCKRYLHFSDEQFSTRYTESLLCELLQYEDHK